MRKLSSFLVAAVFALLTYGLWAYLNQPTEEPPWPSGGRQRVQGFALSPYRDGQDAMKEQYPTEQQIDEDLALLSGKGTAVRTYSTLGTLASIPRLAEQHRLKVMLGAWLDKDKQKNELEVANALRLATKHPDSVIRIIVGNEAVLRGDLTVEEIIPILDRAREATTTPVSTAEPWHVWIKHPELAEHVDFLAVHMLPFWERMPVENAIEFIVDKMERLEEAFPGKRIVIGEVGWPSNGRARGPAVPSMANEALFLRRFLARAKEEGYIYYIMEAFDQPWKEQNGEGSVGAYWGVWDVHRQPKFPFVDPIVAVPEWHTLAAISVVIAALLLGVFFVHSRTLGTRGRSFLAVVVYGIATITVWVIYDYSRQYLSVSSVLVGTLLIVGMLGVIAVLLAEAHEWAEAHWVTSRTRGVEPSRSAMPSWSPKVSVHVPAYNEPPDMLIETLDALARLDYPDYEVLVIDNNTRDENVWRPVEEHCRKLGPRFRFFHVSPLAGFKAGALNYALRNTDPTAEIVAVIDSDYKVEPNWLRDLVPPFAEPRMGIVQAPQDYRDDQENAFKAMCYAEYRGFFHIGMITRNERNAIIQHGTMTLVRRRILEEAGGWSEWCITEDAELGLKIFRLGYEADYLSKSYGKGVMPDTFIDFKKQRFRWAYGAMQILRAHAGSLLSAKGGLTAGQRYHFVAGWLPWLADGFNLAFTAAALFWSAGMIIWPEKVQPPLMIFSVLPMALFMFKIMKLVHLYVTRVGANVRQTLAAALAGLALSHTIGMAVVKGLVTKNEPFFRTPKQAQPHAFATAFASARTETALMVALWIAALGVTRIPEELRSADLAVWTVVLLIQSSPYAAALLVSLASAFALPARLLGSTPPRDVDEEAAEAERL